MALGVGDPLGVGVAPGVAVALGVAVTPGVGVGTTAQASGPRMATVTGVPVLKKPIVAFAASGGWSESNRKLYNVPHRMAFAFWFCAKVSELQLRSVAV